MIFAPLALAFSSTDSIRGWFVPGFCPAMTIRSAFLTSSTVTEPLPMPIASISAAPGRLVAHVRAVRQVVGAEAADHQLVQERGLVAGASRRVEHRLVGVGQRAQFVGDEPVGVLPVDGPVVVVAGAKHHRVGEPALLRQPVLRLGGQLGDRVPGEELRRDDALGGLLGDGLGAVLAELGELAAAVFLGPRAARAVEAVALVEPGQRGGRANRSHRRQPALQRHHHRLDSGCLVFWACGDDRVFVERRVDVPVGVATGSHVSSLGRNRRILSLTSA